MVIWTIINSIGGEIFVPKIPSYRILDVADAISPSCKKTFSGIRPGEKIHEEMITESDGYNCVDLGKYYAILPNRDKFLNIYKKNNIKYELPPKGFSYSSDKNEKFLSINEIRELIKKNVDPNFG